MAGYEQRDYGTPYDSILDDENLYYTYCFCTLCSLMLNQKLNLQKILIQMVKDERLMDIYKEIVNEKDSREAVRLFLSVNPSAFSQKTVVKNLFGPNLS